MTESNGDKALRLLDKLCYAMQRRGTEQDGNWGWPDFADEVAEIRRDIATALPAESAATDPNSQEPVR